MRTNRRTLLKSALHVAAAGSWVRSLVAASSQVVWSASSKEPPQIVCDPESGEPVRFAAVELQRYLERILGVPAASGAKANRGIVLREIDDKELGDEGFEISCDSGTLTISGGPSGVAYGVFEFLRRFAGCQFSGLGPDCEFVPRSDSVEVNVRKLRMTPKLWYRGYQFFYADPLDLIVQRLDWMVRNGVNYVMFTPRRDDIVSANTAIDPTSGQPAGNTYHTFTEAWWKRNVEPEIFKRGLKLDFNHHNLFYWIPPRRHFKTHPEWYPLVNGKRTAEPHQLAICTSNEEAVKTVVENVKFYLRDNPRTKIVGVIVEDGSGMCQCENCIRGDVNSIDAFRDGMGYKYPEGENKSKALRYARLVNRVAREIRDEFPGTLVGHAAYGDIQWPPRGVKLEPNVVTWVAIYWRDGSQPLSADSRSYVNRFFFDVLKQWKATQPVRLIAYEYYMGMEAQKSLPYPMSEVVCRDWPYLKQLGVEGATIQCYSSNHNAYALNNLAFARNAWEDRVDHKALLNDYLSGMFGSAASELTPVFERMTAALKRVEDEGPAFLPWMETYDASRGTGGSFLPDAYTIVYLLDQVGPEFLDSTLRRAKEKASDERERRQVANFAAAVAYWRMAAGALSLDLRAKKAEKEGNRSSAASLATQSAAECERVLEYLKTLPQRGWISVATPDMWGRLATRLRQRARRLESRNPT